MTIKPRLQRDGLLEEPSTEWQMWRKKIYIYHTEAGGLRGGMMRVPADIIRCLGLKHMDPVYYAVKKVEEEAEKDEG